MGRVALVALGVVLAGAWLAWRPAASSAATRTYTAEYKGSLSYNSDWEDKDGRTGAPIYNRTQASLSFDARVFTEVPDGGSPTSNGTLVAQGTYDTQGTNGPNVDTYHCSFRQVPRPDVTSGITAGASGAGATLQLLIAQMNGSGNVPQGGCTTARSVFFGLDSCGSAGCTGVCEENYAASEAGRFAAFQVADGPVVNAYPPVGSKTYKYDVTLNPSGPCFTGTQSVTLSIQAALTLGGGPAKPPPRKHHKPRLTREQRDAKIAALEQIRDTWGKALAACSGTAAFGVLVAAGPAGIAVALVLVPGQAYQCKVYVEIIDDAAHTFADPPLASDTLIARVAKVKSSPPRLPSCARLAGAPRTLCARARVLEIALAGEDVRAADVTRAAEMTISRESFAVGHDHRHAATMQDRALGGLLRELARARRAESAAGARLAGLLRTAGLQVSSTSAQSANEIQVLASRLARKGLSKRKIKTIDGQLLVPGPGDWINALAAS